MNEVSWLQPKNASQPAHSQPKKTDDATDNRANFTAFLSGDNDGGGMGSAVVPLGASDHSAVDRAGAGVRDALTSSIDRAAVFFAAMQKGQLGYSAASQVSDEAIAFNARPIVGPASFNHSPDEIFTAIDGIDGEEFAAARAAIAGSIGLEGRHAITTPESAGGVQPTSAATPRSAAAAGNEIAPTQGGWAAVVDAPVQPLVGGDTAKFGNNSEANVRNSSRTASAAPLLPTQMAAAQSPTLAQVLATPSEYRLVIRGHRLSEDMRELVMRAVRGGLAEYGLPQMPLAVFDQEGRR
ncbi:MAG: hypothetical protein ABJK59_11120 [Erythrobacter sp.]|uniref:hypothetical protein n=1 Tax=Erythrobacter sp. TaxID=1042 RepID=UPI0032983B82